MKLILIRHCETDWNAFKKMQGSSDISLNEHGKEQAKRMVQKLKKYTISKIISSDLKRATETANIISNILKLPISTDIRLRECSFGEFEGQTWEEVGEKYSIKKETIYPNAKDGYDFTNVGGENRDQVLSRLKKFLKDIYNNNETILIVGHGCSLNTLLSSYNKRYNLEREEIEQIEY